MSLISYKLGRRVHLDTYLHRKEKVKWTKTPHSCKRLRRKAEARRGHGIVIINILDKFTKANLQKFQKIVRLKYINEETKKSLKEITHIPRNHLSFPKSHP